MKKIILFSILAMLALGAFSQGAPLPHHLASGVYTYTKVRDIGPLFDNGTIITMNASYTDTVTSGDTLFYRVLINHSTVGFPYISLAERLAGFTTHTKTGYGVGDTLTALCGVAFYQSVDGVHNWQTIEKPYDINTGTIIYDTTKFLANTNGKTKAGLTVADTTLQAYGRAGKFDLLYTTRVGYPYYAASSQTQTRSESALTGQLSRALGSYEYSFWRSNARFESQYLGVRFILGTGTSGNYKAKAVIYGSTRFEKN